MRRFTIILLSCFYFLLASGLHLSLHYCCGELESIGAVASDESSCCGNKMKSSKKKKCCQEKSIVYQIKNSHQVSPQSIAPKVKCSTCLHSAYSELAANDFRFITSHCIEAAAKSPPVSQQKVFIRIGNFRI